MPQYSNQPDFIQILELWWGGAYESSAYAAYQAAAANVIVGTNPPYTLNDFLAVYQKFFGCATDATLTTTAASPNATLVLSANSEIILSAGMFLTAASLPGGTTVLSVGSANAVVLSNPASADGDDVAANVYGAPWLPVVVLQLFINLALASIQQLRWQATWPLGMALFVAHYSTLWMETETSTPNSTAAEIVTSGLQQGVIVSQSAGDVSAGTQPLQGLEDWGSLNLTQYGVQLITLARIMGAGIMWIM
jgi:hypothetical protein